MDSKYCGGGLLGEEGDVSEQDGLTGSGDS